MSGYSGFDVWTFRFQCLDIQVSMSGHSGFNVWTFRFQYLDIQVWIDYSSSFSGEGLAVFSFRSAESAFLQKKY